MRNSILLLLALCLTSFAQVPPPPAASVAEVQAGTVKNKYVSPYTLANSSSSSIPAGVVTNDPAVLAYIASNSITDFSAVQALQKITIKLNASGLRSNLVAGVMFGNRFNPQNLGVFNPNGYALTLAKGTNVSLPIFGDANTAQFNGTNGLDLSGFNLTNCTLVTVWSQIANTNYDYKCVQGDASTTYYEYIMGLSSTNSLDATFLFNGISGNNALQTFLEEKNGGTAIANYNAITTGLSYTTLLYFLRQTWWGGNQGIYPLHRNVTAATCDGAGNHLIWNDCVPMLVSQPSGGHFNLTNANYQTNYHVVNIGYNPRMLYQWHTNANQYLTNSRDMKIESVWLWNTTNSRVVDLTQTISRYGNTAKKDYFFMGTSMNDPSLHGGSAYGYPAYYRTSTNPYSYWVSKLEPDSIVHNYAGGGGSVGGPQGAGNNQGGLLQTYWLSPYPLNALTATPTEYPVEIWCDAWRNSFCYGDDGTTANILSNSVVYFGGLITSNQNVKLYAMETPVQQIGGPLNSIGNGGQLTGYLELEKFPLLSGVFPLYKWYSQYMVSTNAGFTNCIDGIHNLGAVTNSGWACLVNEQMMRRCLSAQSPISCFTPDSLTIAATGATNIQSGCTYSVSLSAGSSVSLVNQFGAAVWSGVTAPVTFDVPPLWSFTGTGIGGVSLSKQP